jgi:hypothetical protein
MCRYHTISTGALAFCRRASRASSSHERLTFKFQGRYFRLTDVHGKVVPGLLA